jgi:hypothetical protein
MNRMTTAIVLSTLATLAGSAPAVTIFNDGVFNNSDWALTTITNGNGAGSSVVGFQVLTGGNPNEYRRIRHNLVVNAAGNGAVIGLHMNVNAFYTPSNSGAISMINYSEDSINFVNQGGNGQGSGLAIMQNGRMYIQRTPILVMPYVPFQNWTANAAPGLVASDLWEVDNTGTLFAGNNPDFSAGGSTMQLGFWRGNSGNFSYQTDCGIDNWHVEIVPSPGAAALLGLGGVLCGARRRRG